MISTIKDFVSTLTKTQTFSTDHDNGEQFFTRTEDGTVIRISGINGFHRISFADAPLNKYDVIISLEEYDSYVKNISDKLEVLDSEGEVIQEEITVTADETPEPTEKD